MHSTWKYTKQFNSTVIAKIWLLLRQGFPIITLVYCWFTIQFCCIACNLLSGSKRKNALFWYSFLAILLEAATKIKYYLHHNFIYTLPRNKTIIFFGAFDVKFIVHCCLISIQPVFDSIRNLSIIYVYVLPFSLAQKINQSMCIISDKNLVLFIHAKWKE